MDRARFDLLTKLCATRGTRRAALAALLGAAVLGTDRASELAAGKGGHKRRQ